MQQGPASTSCVMERWESGHGNHSMKSPGSLTGLGEEATVVPDSSFKVKIRK